MALPVSTGEALAVRLGSRCRAKWLLYAQCLLCLVLLGPASGCTFFPKYSRQPSVHNPFPQLSRIAIAPFFNHSAEPSVSGQQVALAYYNELQSIPGFTVVPIGIVEQTMKDYGLTLSSPLEARKLAQILDVDAVVVGAVTDFTPYYPPRCALQVEWYSANPGYHPIPAGYGLPWGTPEEEHIPPSLVFEAEMALAREQLKTQEPAYVPLPAELKPVDAPQQLPATQGNQRSGDSEGRLISAQTSIVTDQTGAAGATTGIGLPTDWPDPSGFTPRPPSRVRPRLQESIAPVLSHTRTYNGHDSDVTEALRTYVYFRDDARFGGWQSYLQRSDDFTRFCCHMHISEMLTARGGAGETGFVWRWPTGR